MSKYSVAKLACRILSLYTIVNSLSALITVAFLPNQQSVSTRLIIPYIIMMAFGLLIWGAATPLAKAMVMDELEVAPHLSAGSEEIQAIAYSVLGLLLVGTSLPKLVSSVISVLTIPPGLTQLPQASNANSGLIQSVVQFLIGLIIFVGSKGLVRIFRSLRYAGLSKPDRDEYKEE